MVAVALKVTSQTLRVPLFLASRRSGSATSGISNANRRMRVLRRRSLESRVKQLTPLLAKSLPTPALVQITKCLVCLIAPDTELASTVTNGQTLYAATRLQFSRGCVSATSQRL